MKKLFLFFTLFTFSFSLFAQQDSGFTDKAEAKNVMVNGVKEGKWLEKVPFSPGYYTLTIYKAGKASGIVRQFFPSGKLSLTSMYRDGKKNGVETAYSESGQKEAETPFIDGQINGTEKVYYVSSNYKAILYANGKKTEMPQPDSLNGRLTIETPFVNGKKNGVEKQYFLDGKTVMEVTYVNDVQISSKAVPIKKDSTK